MDLPNHPDVERALLTLLASHDHPVRPLNVYGQLADRFKLTTEQMKVRRTDRDEPLWNNRVQWARNRLVQHGLMKKGPRGLWSLTDLGRVTASHQMG
jgi:restriction endonuclease Mrr